VKVVGLILPLGSFQGLPSNRFLQINVILSS